MVKMYVVGLPETSWLAPPPTLNIASMSASTFCPEPPLYVQVKLNVATAPDAKEPDIVFPPVHVTVAPLGEETASVPLRSTVEAP